MLENAACKNGRFQASQNETIRERLPLIEPFSFQ